MTLHTGWKHWDEHLAQFLNKKLNILEIGSYKGDATKWFLDNLSNNPKTKVYAVDTWEGSPEYFNGDFKEVEDIFDKTVKSTLKYKQLIKMKMLSYNALLKLNSEKILFDIIFIDASHEAIDVLSDAVLSWNILKETGALIFDDYLWDQLNNYHFRPKIAIDTFLDVYNTQLKMLYIGYQVIIQKRLKDEFNQPIPVKYYDLMNRLNYYHISDLQHIINKDYAPKKLKFNLKFSNRFEKLVDNNYDFSKICDEKNKNRINTGSIYSKYDLHLFIRHMKDKSQIFKLINTEKNIKNKSYLVKLVDFLDNNLHNSTIENICYVVDNKLLHVKQEDELSFLNIAHSTLHSNKVIEYFLHKKFKNKKFKNYEINTVSSKNEISKKNLSKSHIIYSDLKSIDKIKDNFQKIKVDFLMGGLEDGITSKKINSKSYENNYYVAFFNLIYLALYIQNIGGVAIIGTFSLINEKSIQLLWILKRFYKEVRLTIYDTDVPNTIGNKVICIGFKGISQNDINKLYDIGMNIKKIIPSYNNVNKIYIENIIDIDDSEIDLYNDFKNEIKKYNIDRFNLFSYNQQIINDIIYFDKKHDLSKTKRTNMTNKIFTVQMRYLIEWITKYNLLDSV
jgi:predicted O-methyltransferase YrrM